MGEGYLSPGGIDEVREILKDFDIAKKNILDIGCGSGGITIDLVKEFQAEFVLGVDVEDAPCLRSKALVAKYNLEDKIDIKKFRRNLSLAR